jgi:hypothetical protein
MRYALAAVMIASEIVPANAADGLPRKDCPASFVSVWMNDKEAGAKLLPKEPCWMKTQTGPYVCYKDGCARAHVYFEG